jgi:hypothetical protein
MEPMLDFGALDSTLATRPRRGCRAATARGRRPRYVRAVLYRYRFTTRVEWRERGAWWSRERLEVFVPPIALRPDGPQAEEVPR